MDNVVLYARRSLQRQYYKLTASEQRPAAAIHARSYLPSAMSRWTTHAKNLLKSLDPMPARRLASASHNMFKSITEKSIQRGFRRSKRSGMCVFRISRAVCEIRPELAREIFMHSDLEISKKLTVYYRNTDVHVFIQDVDTRDELDVIWAKVREILQDVLPAGCEIIASGVAMSPIHGYSSDDLISHAVMMLRAQECNLREGIALRA